MVETALFVARLAEEARALGLSPTREALDEALRRRLAGEVRRPPPSRHAARRP